MSDATICPLCGESNECGVAAGKGTCWCFSVTIPPNVLERVPEGVRGTVCVCAKCAERGAHEATQATPTQESIIE